MLDHIVRKDPLAKELLARSLFTEVQLDTFLSNITVQERDGSLSEKLQLRDSHVKSKGSFIRSLRQAQAKLRGSIYTVIVAEYFGLLSKDSLLGMARMGELLSTARGERTDETYVEKLLQVVDKLVV